MVPSHLPGHVVVPLHWTLVPPGPHVPGALPLVPSQTWHALLPPQAVWQHVYPVPDELAMQLPLTHWLPSPPVHAEPSASAGTQLVPLQ